MRSNFYYLLLLGFALAIANGIEAQNADVQDSLALVNFYDSTNGPNWADNSGWLQGQVSSWNGVFLDSAGKVSNLVLSYNGLTGVIPQLIGDFSDLTILALDGNSLTGPIPNVLGNLQSINILVLDGNQLSGSIPPELGNLLNLNILTLNGNLLTGEIPAELGNLINLQELNLGDNQLTGSIPPELGNLQNLSSLYLNNNGLTGALPESLGNLKNLTWLILAYNNLSNGIPDTLGALSNLNVFVLNNNSLTGAITESLGKDIYLTELDLSNNNFSSSIPATLGNDTNLVALYLSNNNLTGSVPASLGNLLRLNDLELDNNSLTDTLPLSIISLNNLSTLILDSNFLTFSSLEGISQYSGTSLNYSPQKTLLQLDFNSSTKQLSVSAGGTLSNNIYTWFVNSQVDTVINGDSTFSISRFTYYTDFSVSVTNSLVQGLTLNSNTFNYQQTTRTCRCFSPNPFNNQISLYVIQGYSYQIFDILGREVVALNGNANAGYNILSTNELRPGCYIIVVTDLQHNITTIDKAIKVP